MNYVDSMTIGSNKRPRRVLNPEDDGKRKVMLMRKVNKVKSLDLKINVTIDECQPMGSEGDKLLSCIGILAR